MFSLSFSPSSFAPRSNSHTETAGTVAYSPSASVETAGSVACSSTSSSSGSSCSFSAVA